LLTVPLSLLVRLATPSASPSTTVILRRFFGEGFSSPYLFRRPFRKGIMSPSIARFKFSIFTRAVLISPLDKCCLISCLAFFHYFFSTALHPVSWSGSCRVMHTQLCCKLTRFVPARTGSSSTAPFPLQQDFLPVHMEAEFMDPSSEKRMLSFRLNPSGAMKQVLKE
jgi:hypothetical protein